jgi:hypothetical protein
MSIAGDAGSVSFAMPKSNTFPGNSPAQEALIKHRQSYIVSLRRGWRRNAKSM